MCVCVCVCVCVCFGSKCLTFFLLRDVFEGLKSCFDLWLSSLLDCIQFYVFLLFEKLFFVKLDSFSIDSYLLRPLDYFFLTDLIAFLIHQTFLEFFLIASRQILDQLRKFMSGR